MLTRRDLTVVIGLTLCAIGATVAVTRITSNGIPDLPPGAWWFLAGLALGLRAKGRLGEYRQAYRHTIHGVGRGHLNLIRGRR